MKHTPGPWAVFGRRRIVREPSKLVATVVGEEDAPLIAAAPMLLDACRTAHARLTAVVLAGGGAALVPTLQLLEDAIGKATDGAVNSVTGRKP